MPFSFVGIKMISIRNTFFGGLTNDLLGTGVLFLTKALLPEYVEQEKYIFFLMCDWAA